MKFSLPLVEGHDLGDVNDRDISQLEAEAGDVADSDEGALVGGVDTAFNGLNDLAVDGAGNFN